eukprot:scaffold5448_cov59-Phaeocystis_antarctica.AAC.2
MRYLFYELANFDEDVSSWDTSSVTTMYGMFYVRTLARVLCPVSSRELRARCVHRHRRHAPSHPPTHVSPSTWLHATRQGAYAFNQPLSFDTSSVTNMDSMFIVRSLPRACRARAVSSRFLRARCVHRHTAPTRPRASNPRVSLHVPRCDSAGRGSVQPAAEPRHVQRHDHVQHV